jgi:hypothetical protein
MVEFLHKAIIMTEKNNKLLMLLFTILTFKIIKWIIFLYIIAAFIAIWRFFFVFFITQTLYNNKYLDIIIIRLIITLRANLNFYQKIDLFSLAIQNYFIILFFPLSCKTISLSFKIYNDLKFEMILKNKKPIKIIINSIREDFFDNPIIAKEFYLFQKKINII